MRPAIFVFAETALETIPSEISDHAMIRDEALKRHKQPEEILLDSNKHNMPMRDLKDAQRRGRPDILHFSLLVALESAAAKTGSLKKVLVHTQQNQILSFSPVIRLPRAYNRFCGIMEQLLSQGSTDLISSEKSNGFPEFFEKLIAEEKPDDIFFFNEAGEEGTLQDLQKDVKAALKKEGDSPIVFVFGCFPHGTILPQVRNSLLKHKAKEVRIGKEILVVWTLVSMACTIYELEAGL